MYTDVVEVGRVREDKTGYRFQGKEGGEISEIRVGDWVLDPGERCAAGRVEVLVVRPWSQDGNLSVTERPRGVKGRCRRVE